MGNNIEYYKENALLDQKAQHSYKAMASNQIKACFGEYKLAMFAPGWKMICTSDELPVFACCDSYFDGAAHHRYAYDISNSRLLNADHLEISQLLKF